MPFDGLRYRKISLESQGCDKVPSDGSSRRSKSSKGRCHSKKSSNKLFCGRMSRDGREHSKRTIYGKYSRKYKRISITKYYGILPLFFRLLIKDIIIYIYIIETELLINKNVTPTIKEQTILT